MKNVIKISENDNVVVALRDLEKGQIIEIDNEKVSLKEAVKRGHKIAVRKIKLNENIIKYGFPIGHAICDISEGEWVHTHNVKTNLDGIKDYNFNQRLIKNVFQNKNLTFKGYRRNNGNVGIRNELWIVPTVGCINGIADKVIEKFKVELGNLNIDNTLVLKHNYGCSQLGDDHKNTRTILIDAVKHPNAGGVLVMGLGCENNNMDEFKKALGEFDEKRVKFLVAQEVSDEIEEGVKLLKEL